MVSVLGLRITRPDKASGVVILNHYDYVDKMMTILNDTSKFIKLGTVDSYDSTVTLENRFQGKFVKFSGVLPSDIASEIRPLGSLRSRLYGLPKIHKGGTPLRPILSMVVSAQHKVAK